MNLRGSDIVPISEARARLTELAHGVVDGASEKILTQNGACSFGHIAGGLMARPPHARLGAAPDFATPLAQAHAFLPCKMPTRPTRDATSSMLSYGT